MTQFVSKLAGQRIELGGEIARGGEGAIFAVNGGASLVAKVYLKNPDSKKVAKVSAMASAKTSALTSIAAWPTDVIADQRGAVRGFLMPRIQSKHDAHELYSPKSRAYTFPEADFRFIVHVAANVARAFYTIHDAGHVIGDINHGHLLIGTDGRVTLIDADSFQVSINGQLFTCDVGTPLFTPAELQGVTSFRGLVRTKNHDLFGLAVILFHLLYLGRHPYAGRYAGGEMPIEKAIQEGRFVYGGRAAAFRMSPPPHTLPLNAFGPDIARLFESAFSSPPNSARPAATQWVASLEALQSGLKPCGRSPAHSYPQSLSQCPWCAIENAVGVRLFGQKFHAGPTGTIDLASLWAVIEKVPRPGPDLPLPSQLRWSPPVGIEIPSKAPKIIRKFAAVAVGGLALVAFNQMFDGSGWLALFLLFGAFLVWPRPPAQAFMEANRKITEARTAWDQLLERWNREASVKAFDSAKEELRKVHTSLADLANERTRRLTKLRSEYQQIMRERFLDGFRIDQAKISGIGSGRAATLAAWGVETAFDITPASIAKVPGFGPKLESELLYWRQTVEAQFRFNPSAPIDPKEITRVESEILALRQTYIKALQLGAKTLIRMAQEIPLARERLMPSLKREWDALKVAELQRSAL